MPTSRARGSSRLRSHGRGPHRRRRALGGGPPRRHVWPSPAADRRRPKVGIADGDDAENDVSRRFPPPPLRRRCRRLRRHRRLLRRRRRCGQRRRHRREK